MNRKKNHHHHDRHKSSGGRDSERRSHHNSFHQDHHQSGTHHRAAQENQSAEQYHRIPPFEPDQYLSVHQSVHSLSNQRQYAFPNQDIPNQGYPMQSGFHPIQSGYHPSIVPMNPQNAGQNFMDLPNLAYPNDSAEATAATMTQAETISALALQRLKLPQDMIEQSGIIPNNPYYELPAGLMAPLVPASRRVYKPLNPKELRLPFPRFPDENFLNMIDSYYKTDDDRRDNDGWHREFIETYLKQKEALSAMQDE